MQLILETYSVYDNKVNSYKIPLYFKNVHEAKADLTGAMELYKGKLNPIDYELYHLGSYDTETGKHKLLDKPTHICSLRSLAKEQKPIINKEKVKV